ncbi:MAG: diguanylate cyclase, partial [bacterium]|nr:diguanylate cyclase [bacterium]
QYRLEGFNSDWISTPADRRIASYMNLDPGDYIFQVRASNRDGVWADGRPLRVRILPSPWTTLFAYALYSLAAASAIGTVVWKRARKLALERRTAKTLRTSEQRLNLALTGSGDGLWDWDLSSGEVFRSRVAEMFGYTKSELPAGHEFRHTLIHPEDEPWVEEELRSLAEGKITRLEIEYRMQHKDGDWRWILDRGTVAARDEFNRPTRVAGTCKDVTQGKAVEAELRLWATVFKNISEGVVITSPNEEILAANEAFCRMTGYDQSAILGQKRSILHSGRHSRGFYDEVLETMESRGRWRGELWLKRNSGTPFLTWTDINRGCGPSGEVTHYVTVCTDITHRKQAEQELRYLANYDVLTGLPNRTLFLDRLGHALNQAKRAQRKLAILFADLDRFKQVNDSLGHAAGDLVLQEAARRLLRAVREVDTVARFSGDEFTVLVEDIVGEGDIEPIADRIVKTLAQPFSVAGHEVNLSASIGASMYPRDGDSTEELLRNADMAMYRAKSKGSRWIFYSHEMSATAVHRLQLEHELRDALKQGNFTLLYQPKLHLNRQKVIGGEALLRWRHHSEGLIEPGRFLDLAEDTGLIIPIGEWVLLTACAECAFWQKPGHSPVEVAVNISASQLQSDELYASVTRALDKTGLDPRLLVLELTETMLMENAERSVSVLLQLKNLGVQISIDDFGTGYSSLSYLKMLPIDELKI